VAYFKALPSIYLELKEKSSIRIADLRVLNPDPGPPGNIAKVPILYGKVKRSR
jgi:hypothetical protein